MKLNNTNNNYSIISKNENNKRYIISSGIVVTSLLISLSLNIKNSNNTHVINQANESSVSEVDDGYAYYTGQYMKSLEKMNMDEFDDNFIDIYKYGKYTINNNTYDIKEIYIVKCEDETIHLTYSNNNKVDILSGKSLDSKKKIICCFRDSSIFFNLYRDKLFSTKNIKIDNYTLQQYINDWDLTKHNEVPELRANNEAGENYKKVYGR